MASINALRPSPRMVEPDSLNAAAPVLPQIGSYRLIQQLGSGGMSSVFRAIHAETGHEVAVKVLPRYLAKNPTLLQRFLREAKTAEALEHPNIVAIFDRGSEAGRYYLVLEYVAGGDLHDQVRNVGTLAPAVVVLILKAVSEGLRYASGKGLIHRDIKPANLLMTPEGLVKITDLGLALQVEEEDERVTRDGTTVGTVDYMAPEQARDSRATSIRSDIYSLGCTSYFLLTGSPPFPGGDVSEKLRRHAQEVPPPVRQARPDVPEWLSEVIQKMMAKRPEKRFADYDELLAALDGTTVGEKLAAPVFALIDDEDDELLVREAPLNAGDLLSLAEASPTIESVQRPRPPSDTPRRRPPSDVVRPQQTRPSRDDVSISDLVALDDDTPAIPKRRAPLVAATPAPAPAPSPRYDDLVPMAPTALPPRGAKDDSLQAYMLRGLMIGLVIVAIGIGIHQIIALSSTANEPPPEETPAEEESLMDRSANPAPRVVLTSRENRQHPLPRGAGICNYG